VKIIVNWLVRKKKTFENNYSQGRSWMGMPLRYTIQEFWMLQKPF
jgi:hypothetical protein